MSYPHAVQTGREVIAAALEWEDAVTQQAEDFDVWEDRLVYAVRAHRAATAVEHVNAPDIDADEQRP